MLYMVDSAMNEVLYHLHYIKSHLEKYKQAETANEIGRLGLELHRMFCDAIRELPDGAYIMDYNPPEFWSQDDSERISEFHARGHGHWDGENLSDILKAEAEAENNKLQQLELEPQQLLPGEQSSANLVQVDAPASTAPGAPSKDSKHMILKTRRALPVPMPDKSMVQDAYIPNPPASIGAEQAIEENRFISGGKAGVVHIHGPVFNNAANFIRFITKRIHEGPLQDIIIESSQKATVVFHHAAQAKYFWGLNRDRNTARFPNHYRLVLGDEFEWDENHLRMELPIKERRRLTFVRARLFSKDLTTEKWRQHITSIAGARNIELTWVFNSGNATAVFSSTTVARQVLETFNEWKNTRKVYKGVRVSYSFDPCERQLCLTSS